MRYIAKGAEPKDFAEWRRKNRGANWDDFYDSSEYPIVKSRLVNEQNNLCCYCEISINGDGDTHIEHHKPKSRYIRDTFNYQNLLASCQGPDCCGHKKQSDYFDELVSPLSTNCQERFIYTGLGNIIPKDENDSFAHDTIDLLGLDCNRLRDRRESILKALEHPEIDDDYIIDSMENHREWYGGFYTVIQHIAKKRNIRGGGDTQ